MDTTNAKTITQLVVKEIQEKIKMTLIESF